MPSAPRTRTSYMAHRDGAVPDADDPLLDFTPVPHKAPRRNSIGPERQRAFVAHLAATGIVRQAALHIGASLEALYKLRHKEGAEEFAAAWDAAVDRGVQRLEDCALERAIQGDERMVVSGGELMGYERRHNDALVMFFLRNRRPERYGHVTQQRLKPGHPEYERIREELRPPYVDIEDVRAEILRKVAAMEEAKKRQEAERDADEADCPAEEERPALFPPSPETPG